MAKYEVTVRATVIGSITVESDSAEEAERYAENQFDLDMTEPSWCIVDSVDVDAFREGESK